MKRLKEYRIKRELSQSELSKLTGVNLRMIQFYESGFKNINHAHADTVCKLATVLNCKMEDLIERFES